MCDENIAFLSGGEDDKDKARKRRQVKLDLSVKISPNQKDKSRKVSNDHYRVVKDRSLVDYKNCIYLSNGKLYLKITQKMFIIF